MLRLPAPSLYCVVWRSLARPLLNEYFMLIPAIGVCLIPLTIFGAGMPTASRIVGTTSITLAYCRRISPLVLMPAGQCTAMPALLPPPCAIVIAYVAGVEPAMAQPTA